MVEDVLRPIRLGMAGAGIAVEDSKGECNFGQHEVNFRYSDALAMADNHSVYKNGAKEIAHMHGCALSFMAKYDQREGNSCHIHISLWDDKGSFSPGEDGRGRSRIFDHFVAGQLAATRELAYFFAPNVNSYKRYAWGSFAPTTLVWGVDNRTCGFRVVGHGAGLRLESRISGADVNPYIAFAAMIAAGLHGIDNELALEPAYPGNAYDAVDKPKLPGACTRRWRCSRARRSRGRRLGTMPSTTTCIRAHGAARVRGSGHRLGALPQLRAHVRRAPGGAGRPLTQTRSLGLAVRAADQLGNHLPAPVAASLVTHVACDAHEVVVLGLRARLGELSF